MDEWLKNLWKNNKFFFILLLPVVLIVVFKDLLLQVLIGSVHETAEEAKEKDHDLEKKQVAANTEADRLRDEASKLEGKINEGSADEDWNKR